MKLSTNNYDEKNTIELLKIIRLSLIIGCFFSLLFLIIGVIIKPTNYNLSLAYFLGMIVSNLSYYLKIKYLENTLPVNLKSRFKKLFLIKSFIYILTLIASIFLFKKDIMAYLLTVFGLIEVQLCIFISEFIQKRSKKE